MVNIIRDSDKQHTKSGTVVGILPVTIDTPSNREGMPNADFSAWTPV